MVLRCILCVNFHLPGFRLNPAWPMPYIHEKMVLKERVSRRCVEAFGYTEIGTEDSCATYTTAQAGPVLGMAQVQRGPVR